MNITFDHLWKYGTAFASGLLIAAGLYWSEHYKVEALEFKVRQLERDQCFTYNRVMRIEYGVGAVEPCE